MADVSHRGLIGAQLPASETCQDLIDELEARVAALEAASVPSGGGGEGGTPGSGLGYFNVLDYDAVGDGVTDDTLFIQAAIDAALAAGGGVIYFPPGYTYLVTKQGSSLASFDLDGVTDLTFMGGGWNSVILKEKDFAGDYYTFRLRGGTARIEFAHLTLDGNFEAEVGDEQNHLIQIGNGDADGGVADVFIRNCWFHDCKGDAVRILGYSTTGAISNVRVTQSKFTDCGRTSVSIQRGVGDIHIIDNFMRGGNDSLIDFEPTGDVVVERFIITGNTLYHTNNTVAVTLTGGSNSPHQHSIFSDNILIEGEVQGVGVDGLRFVNNVILGRATHGNPCLYLFRRVDNTLIQGNYFRLGVGADVSLHNYPVVYVAMNDGVQPNAVKVIGNHIVQETKESGINFDSANSSTIYGNTLQYENATSDYSAGIAVQAVQADIESVDISHNVIEGAAGGGRWLYGVYAPTTSFDIDRCVIVGNSGTGCYDGVRVYKGTGAFTKYPLVSLNCIGNADFEVLHTNVIIVTAGSPGCGAVYRGAGSPEGVVTAPIGDMYVRTDGGAGTTLYIKESGSGNTGWVGK